MNIKPLQDMTEPELKDYFNNRMSALEQFKAPDVMGIMLIEFGDDGITQYASSIDPSCAPNALRELASRLENRQGVTRGWDPGEPNDNPIPEWVARDAVNFCRAYVRFLDGARNALDGQAKIARGVVNGMK